MTHSDVQVAAERKARWRQLAWPTVWTLVGVAILVSLGTWQLHRKAWKEGLLAQIAARTTADPAPIEAALKRWQAGEDIEYLRVEVRGRLLPDKTSFLYAPGAEGPGYHAYTPLQMADGRFVIVNRGFLPERLKPAIQHGEGVPQNEVDVIGLVRRPGRKGWFTPDNDLTHNLWFWRDLPGMAAAAFGSGADVRVAPFFVDAEATAAPGWPRGGVTRLDLPNRHLEYVLTWYGLAGALIAVYLAFAVGKLKGP